MTTLEQVQKIIVDTLNCGEDEVTLEASLMDDLGADSLDAVELSMAIEEEFQTEIPDEEMAAFKTVGDIVAFLDGKA